MISLYKKEINLFFSTSIGPLIICLYLLINGLILWSDISEFNILNNGYSSLDNFFTLSPLLFLLFIPAISMRSFSEEYNTGTIEIIITKPIRNHHIIISKFLSILTLIILSILPTLLYVITIYYLGETKGNLDLAGIAGSYIGLLMISCVFTSISIFASSISKHQIIAFISAVIICAFFYFGFDIISNIKALQTINIIIKKIGISYHYSIMSKGLLLISDLVYFISISFLFLKFADFIIQNKH